MGYDSEKLRKYMEKQTLIPAKSLQALVDIESAEFMDSFGQTGERFIPEINYGNPAEFARFGSAEQYYEDSIKRIANQYPFDGSLNEKMQWNLSSSFLDLWLFNNDYPKAVGSFNFSSTGWGSKAATSGDYHLSSDQEYIEIFGGPGVGDLYSEELSRGSSLLFDPENGNTVEMWIKHGAFDSSGTGPREVIFDCHSKASSELSDSARIRLEYDTTKGANDNCLMFTYMSGAANNGFLGVLLPGSLTSTLTDGSWHHIAVSVKQTVIEDNPTLTAYFYLDRERVGNISTAPNVIMGKCNKNMVATVGALSTERYEWSAGFNTGGKGYGKLNASIDDFRFWKSERGPELIGRFFQEEVHGGTEADHTNAKLGIYYKFNEGTSYSSSKVLDYSGRAKDGQVHGYKQTMRSAVSALNTVQDLCGNDRQPVICTRIGDGFREVPDPIIFVNSAEVQAKLEEYKELGISHDALNSSMLKHTFPSFMLEEDESGDLKKMIQIIASYFDELYAVIDHLPNLRNISYTDVSGSRPDEVMPRLDVDTENTTFCEEEVFTRVRTQFHDPTRIRLMQAFNPAVYDMFSIANELETYMGRTHGSVRFEHSIEEVKGFIIQNIHNNLNHIYKTKGTENSFRNLIRCFGIDDELVKFRSYANNGEFDVEDNNIYTTYKVKSLDATRLDNTFVTVMQTLSDCPVTRDFIEPGPQSASGSFTAETNIIIPPDASFESGRYRKNYFQTASIMGFANTASAGSPGRDLYVEIIRDSVKNTDARFRITGPDVGVYNLTSPYIPDVYGDEGSRWNLQVKLRPSRDDTFRSVTGAPNTYILEFVGKNYQLDEQVESFNVSGTLTKAVADAFLTQQKRFYLGCRRANYTGSSEVQTNVKFLNATLWQDHLSDVEASSHSKDPSNYGRINSFMPLNQATAADDNFDIKVKDSILLRWEFDNTFTTSSNNRYVSDLTSGSAEKVASLGSYGQIVGYDHPAIITNIIDDSRVITQEFIPIAKFSDIDNVHSSDQIQILDADRVEFKRSQKPLTHYFSFEKSMYAVISEQMLKYFGSLVEINNLIGEPTNKYRQSYKGLDKLKQQFFDKVQADIDLDKFVEFYRWIDNSLSKFLDKLKPLSANFSKNIFNMVESHALERNKYQHKFPTLEMKLDDPEAPMLGINELLYDWEHGHAPLIRVMNETQIRTMNFVKAEGTTTYVQIPDTSDHSLTTATADLPFTIAFWANRSSAASCYPFGKWGSEYYLNLTGQVLDLRFYDGSQDKYRKFRSSNIYPNVIGTWVHVAIVHNSGQVKYYINGSLADTVDGVDDPAGYEDMNDAPVGLRIGTYSNTQAGFGGKLSNFIIFKQDASETALNAQEISELYNAGRTYDYSRHSRFSDVVGWWKLGGPLDNSTIIKDLSGKNHHGTVNNADSFVNNSGLHEELLQAKEETQCLWWADRAEGDREFDHTSIIGEQRENNRIVDNTFAASGSTYVLRKLTKPYKFGVDNQPILRGGQTKTAYKIDDFYKVVNYHHSDEKIQLLKSNIREQDPCKDVVIPETKKVFKGLTSTEGHTGYYDADSDIVFPFSLHSSSARSSFPSIQEGMIVTNNHHDQYGEDHEIPLQGPFTQHFVGGMPHRHVEYLVEPTTAQKTSSARPEAYNLKENANTSITLEPRTVNEATSRYYRDGTAKRSVNIKNIKYSTNSQVIGNYSRDYQVVMTNGRTNNNNDFVDNEGYNLSFANSDYIAGLVNQIKPAGTLIAAGHEAGQPMRTRTEHVIVNKFSAPGSPETAYDSFGTNYESNEYSVYNTINYRNLNVRRVLNRLHSEKSNQFGVRVGSTVEKETYEVVTAQSTVPEALRLTVAGSVHKTNRNPSYTDFSTDAYDLSNPSAIIAYTGNPQLGEKITLTSATGVTKTYEFSNAIGPTNVLIGENATVTYNSLSTAINAGSNQNNMFVLEQTVVDTNTGKLTITQKVSGPSGNTVIVENLSLADVNLNRPGNTNHLGQTVFTNGSEFTEDYDNFVVYHPIPQNDMQYTWVTASALDVVQTFKGHTSNFTVPTLGGISEFPKQIEFLTESEYGIYYHNGSTNRGIRFGITKEGTDDGSERVDFTPVDFAGMNTVILDPVDKETNHLGHATGVQIGANNLGIHAATKESEDNYFNWDYIDYINAGRSVDSTAVFRAGHALGLNSLIHHRQGPYGWPSWKQLRTSQHPIARNLRKSNLYSVSYRGSQYSPSPIKHYDYHNLIVPDLRSAKEDRKVKNYYDTPVTSKFDPLIFMEFGYRNLRNSIRTMATSNGSLPQKFEKVFWELADLNSVFPTGSGVQENIYFAMRDTYGNDITSFANPLLIKDLGIDELEREMPWQSMARQAASEGFNISNSYFDQVSYIEVIYPREENTYSKDIRERVNFSFSWKTLQLDRIVTLNSNTYSDYDSSNGGSVDFKKITTDKIFENKNSMFVDRIDWKNNETDFHSVVQSSWPLDARREFEKFPYCLTRSYTTEANVTFRDNRDQSTRGEGELLNDYSIFALGFNSLHGLPPAGQVYSRRVPQDIKSAAVSNHNNFEKVEILAGESKWEVPLQSGIDPLENSYQDFSHEARLVGQNYSIIPEFKISDHIDTMLDSATGTINKETFDIPLANMFSLTGATYQDSGLDISVGSKFYKTYSTSDFLKYFEVINDTFVESTNHRATRLTLRCNAVLKFLPYKGFYPAERSLQLGSMFAKNYMTSFRHKHFSGDDISNVLDKKISGSLSQAIKPLFAPGVLYNSIKSGLAVDYPIFENKGTGNPSSIVLVFSPNAKFGGNNMKVQTDGEGSVIQWWDYDDYVLDASASPGGTADVMPSITMRLWTGSATEKKFFFTSLPSLVAKNAADPNFITTSNNNGIHWVPILNSIRPPYIREGVNNTQSEVFTDRLGTTLMFVFEAIKAGFNPYNGAEDPHNRFGNTFEQVTTISQDKLSRLAPEFLEAISYLINRDFDGLRTVLANGTTFGNFLTVIIAAMAIGSLPPEQRVTPELRSFPLELLDVFYLFMQLGIIPGMGTQSQGGFIVLFEQPSFGTGGDLTVKVADGFIGSGHDSPFSNTKIPIILNAQLDPLREGFFAAGSGVNSSTPAGVEFNATIPTPGANYTDGTWSFAEGVSNVLTDSELFRAQKEAISTNAELTTLGTKLNSSAITGSFVNGTADCGIPRLSSKVSKRVTFEELLDPARLKGTIMYDNEPHPSASLFYGNFRWFKTFDYPNHFADVNQQYTAGSQGLYSFSSESDFLPFKIAMNNFASETVNFFLENQALTNLTSSEVAFFAKPGETLKMRLYLANQDTMMYDRRSAFGPPVNAGDFEKEVYTLANETVGVPGVAATAVLVRHGSFAAPNTSVVSDIPKIKVVTNDGTTRFVGFYDAANFVTTTSAAAATVSFEFASVASTVSSVADVAIPTEDELHGFGIEDTSGNKFNIRYYDSQDYLSPPQSHTITSTTGTDAAQVNAFFELNFKAASAITNIGGYCVQQGNNAGFNLDPDNHCDDFNGIPGFTLQRPDGSNSISISYYDSDRFVTNSSTSSSESVATNFAGTRASHTFQIELSAENANQQSFWAASWTEGSIPNSTDMDDVGSLVIRTLVNDIVRTDGSVDSSNSQNIVQFSLINTKGSSGVNQDEGPWQRVGPNWPKNRVWRNNSTPADHFLIDIFFDSGDSGSSESTIIGSGVADNASIAAVFAAAVGEAQGISAIAVQGAEVTIRMNHEGNVNTLSSSPGFGTPFVKNTGASTLGLSPKGMSTIFGHPNNSQVTGGTIHKLWWINDAAADNSSSGAFLFDNPGSDVIRTTTTTSTTTLTDWQGNTISSQLELPVSALPTGNIQYIDVKGKSAAQIAGETALAIEADQDNTTASWKAAADSSGKLKVEYTGDASAWTSTQLQANNGKWDLLSRSDMNAGDREYGAPNFFSNIVTQSSAPTMTAQVDATSQVTTTTTTVRTEMGLSAPTNSRRTRSLDVRERLFHQDFQSNTTGITDIASSSQGTIARSTTAPSSNPHNKILRLFTKSGQISTPNDKPTYSIHSSDSGIATYLASANWIGFQTSNAFATPLIVKVDLIMGDNSSGVSFDYGLTKRPESDESNDSLSHHNDNWNHLWLQWSKDGGSTWITGQEIIPDLDFANRFTSAGFAIPTDEGNVHIRLLAAGDLASGTTEEDMWGIDSISVLKYGTELSDPLESDATIRNRTRELINAVDSSTISITASDDSVKGIKLDQDSTGTAGNTTITVTSAGLTPIVTGNAPTTFADGAGATSTPNPPSNTSDTRFIAVTDSTSESDLYNAVANNLVAFNVGLRATVAADSLTIEQPSVGTSGNDATGPGELTYVNPSAASSEALVFAAVGDFTGGVNDSTEVVTTFFGKSKQNVGCNHDYHPFTPPFLSPNSAPYVEFTINPKEGKKYNYDDLMSDLEISYVNFKETPSNAATSAGNINHDLVYAMNLAASLDLKSGYIEPQITTETETTGVTTSTRKSAKIPKSSSSEDKKWVIQTKWETPILDFQDISMSALKFDKSNSTLNPQVVQVTDSPWQPDTWSNYLTSSNSVADSQNYVTGSRGMWHQYGSIPSSKKGLYLQVTDVPGYRSLANAVGFTSPGRQTKKRIGEIAKNRLISEAVVAIPYYCDSQNKVNFFKLTQEKILKAREYNRNLESIDKDSPEYKFYSMNPVNPIAYQMKMMEKYIFPPQFDFVTYPNKITRDEAIAMYVFEFRAELDQKDLSNIWQNTRPQSETSCVDIQHSSLSEKPIVNGSSSRAGEAGDTIFISHELGGGNILEDPLTNEFASEKVRWMVFKVKLRAVDDYAKIQAKSTFKNTVFSELIPEQMKFSLSSYREDSELRRIPFSHNWPYDFFSLVELVKIDAKVDYIKQGNPRK